MAAFSCRTRDASGSVVERMIHAGSQREALSILEESGLFPIKVAKVRGQDAATSATATDAARPARWRIGRRVKRRDLMRFTLQLGSSLSAGVPILTVLESVREQTGSEALRAVLVQMIIDIGSGEPLSDAMRRHPRAFPVVYCATIAAGEKSGSLEQVLENLAEYLEAEIEMRSDVRSAVLYPAIVICTLFVAITILVVFIVPRFATFYSGFDVELPLVTRILVSGSTALANHSSFVLIGLAALTIGGIRLARIDSVRDVLDRTLLRIPVIGHMVETAITLHVVQMLGLFTQAGVPVLEGLETISTATANSKMRKDLLAVAEGIAGGETLTGSMEAAGCFPPVARQMLASGESSGTLERACFVVARHYKKELHYLTKNLATLIEPALTLVLAVVVLFVALAAFLPMWDMVKVVGK